MGVATEGTLLTWEQIITHKEKLKRKALDQLLQLWSARRLNHSDGSSWGDEIEYQLVDLDHSSNVARLSLRQDDVLNDAETRGTKFEWQPEYTRYMIESAPAKPFTYDVQDLAKVHGDMARRRLELQELLTNDAVPLTLTLFPLLGDPHNKYDGEQSILQQSEYASSRFVPDEVISPRSRYRILEANARTKRGKPMHMEIPIYQDAQTTSPWYDPGVEKMEAGENQISLEGTIFGPGACGLQVTLECEDAHEACEAHDQLCVLGPVMLALTAGTPIFKGYLADVDARWNTTSRLYDDRTEEEKQKIPPRWSTCSMYLAEQRNDDPKRQQEEAQNPIIARLEQAGMKSQLAHYYADYFQRSMFLVTETDIDDEQENDDFSLWTRFSGTVFPHVRLKMPEAETDGWRIEFRPMEVQHTDFENAACVVFIAICRRAISQHKLDFRIPMEKVHQDMDKAHARDACLNQRFWWRRIRVSQSDDKKLYTDLQAELLSLDQIFNGEPSSASDGGSIGLVDLCWQCAKQLSGGDDSRDKSSADLAKVRAYLDFIRDRASGVEPTGARWMRSIVQSHQHYQCDSEIKTSICYEICKQIQERVQRDLEDAVG